MALFAVSQIRSEDCRWMQIYSLGHQIGPLGMLKPALIESMMVWQCSEYCLGVKDMFPCRVWGCIIRVLMGFLDRLVWYDFSMRKIFPIFLSCSNKITRVCRLHSCVGLFFVRLHVFKIICPICPGRCE